MGEWITIPAFVDDEIIPARTFQDIWANLYSLKDGESDSQQMPGESSDTWTTTSTTFVVINADYYVLTIESFGGDLLIIADIENSNADAAQFPQFTIFIDGENVGGSEGLYRKGEGDIFEARQLLFMATGIDAGTHTIQVYMKTTSGGTTKVFKRPCMKYSVTELS